MNGKTVADNERYVVIDYDFEGLTISQTSLHPSQATRGHSHPNRELMILVTPARIELNDEIQSFIKGQVVVIEPNDFHRVHNHFAYTDVIFYSIFKGKREDRQAKY